MGTRNDLVKEIAAIINIASREGASDTPDYILAEFMVQSLEAYETAVRARTVNSGGVVKDLCGDVQ